MNFKFDKESSDIDLSTGGDNGATPKKTSTPNNSNEPKSSDKPVDQPQKEQPKILPVRTAKKLQKPSPQPVLAPRKPIPKTGVSQKNTLPQKSDNERKVLPAEQAPAPTTPISNRARPSRPHPQQETHPGHDVPTDSNVDVSGSEEGDIPQEQYEHVQHRRQPVQQNPIPNQENPYEYPVNTPSYSKPQQLVEQSEPLPIQKYAEPQMIKPSEDNKKGKTKRSLFSKSVKEKKISGLRGGRKNVFIVKIILSGIILILGIMGGKALFFPTQFPSPQQVISAVRGDLAITKFPVNKANSFVIDFVKTYLTVTSGSASEKDLALAKFSSPAVMDAMQMSVRNDPNVEGSVEQTLLAEPVITGVDAIDDNNAVFTVQSHLSSGTTLLLSIPVYYNEKNNSMAISAPASILPAIGLAEVPTENHKIEWSTDNDVVQSFQPDLENYLAAWADSNSDLITRYLTNNATLAAKTGLNKTVVFSKLNSLTVQLKEENVDANMTEREALFSVDWSDVNAPNIVYSQSYLLEIVRQPDKRWYVKDITGVIIDQTNK